MDDGDHPRGHQHQVEALELQQPWVALLQRLQVHPKKMCKYNEFLILEIVAFT
jgi:hypothetical protein